MEGYLKLQKIIFIAGVIFLSLGFILNPWIVASLFSADGVISIQNSRAIQILDTLSIISGLLFIFLRKISPTLTTVLFGILISFLILSIAEGIFFLINYQKDSESKISYSSPLFMKDEMLGYKFTPAVKVFSERHDDNRLTYAVSYSIDSMGRRFTPCDSIELRNKFLMFLGCSIAFGHGLNDNQTLPFHTAQTMNQYVPYNYGVEGYGPQQVLLKFQKENIRKEIPQQHGTGLYIFTDDHILRAIGSMEVYNIWGQDMPYYTYEKKQLRHCGNFTTGRPVLSSFYWILGKSQILKYFKTNFPLRITEDHLILTSKILEEIYKRFKHEFPESNYYVVFYPGTHYASQMISLLEKAHVPYLNYSTLFDATSKNYLITTDGHPNEDADRIVARKLSEDLSAVKQ